MKKFKLIAFDIDGTILDTKHHVCNKLKQVVQKLKQCGYIFTIVSARFPSSALKIAEELGLDQNEAIVTLNGGFITNGFHEVILHDTFDATLINTHISAINENIAVNYYNGFNWAVNQHTKYIDFELFAANLLDNDFIIGRLDIVNKMSLMGDNEHLLHAQKVLQSLDENLLVSFSHPNYLELTPNHITKYTGLCAYARALNIETHEIIAFGDGENDIPMLSNVGLGIAMDNANLHVKMAANDVAPHHQDQGVAIYLENLIAKGLL